MCNSKKFLLQNNSVLFPEEQKALTLLYQPLIGAEAVGLYYTLYFLGRNQFNEYNLTHQFLFDLLNIDNNVFTKCKDKLEAVKLLDTYQDSKGDRIYVIRNPLNSTLFFQDPLFSQFLFSELGEYYFVLEKLFVLKQKSVPEDFQNISKTFVDIYHLEKINTQEFLALRTQKNVNDSVEKSNQLTVLQKYFDYEVFLHCLPERFKKPFLLSKLQNIDYITKLGFAYMITPQQMALLYQNVFRNNYGNDVDLNILRNVLMSKYDEKKTYVKVINTSNISDDQNKMILCLKKSHPMNIIKNFGKNIFINKRVYDDLFVLIHKNNVDIGVINSLLMYICKKKAHENYFEISYNYCETILRSWLKRGIVSAENAYNYLIEELEYKARKYKKNVKNSPKWLDDFEKSFC
ncbi:DnaD domain protein [Candidatus Phytoplasma melaleucae]|uniref:DnaD domain protein n=1 Tax=Candidatus Phytoplasma melaleucae TaxID=2982630 RepID=A0ABT9DDE3_9MOLU|nr:DnaD domain protein ['Melaleuca sp.' phytoplasma]MDO8167903.1 DnaD domain protein ['Melaleuca sp.' phytoplasma]MDV3205190.1 DnaD domain protein [Weeping tea tree witches'-broom phytoplasma]